MGDLIAHVDMDAFFVSVELLSRPELRGKPVIVGGSGGRWSARGVVTAASYEARRYGVHSAQPLAKARRLCPDAILLPASRGSYSRASRQVMEIIAGYSEEIEIAGLDEAYLDLGEPLTPKAIARRLKHEIRTQTGLVASVGLGPNKLCAKIASDLDKPDGLFVLERERFLELIGARPARIIPGVGPKTAARLARYRIHTVAELAQADDDVLARAVGANHGPALRRRATGEGAAGVTSRRRRKSESRERTFEQDLTTRDEMVTALRAMSESLAGGLAEHARSGRTVTIKVRLVPFETHTRSRTLAEPTAERAVIARTAIELLDEFEPRRPVRLLGVGVSSLEGEEPSGPAPARGAGPVQLSLD